VKETQPAQASFPRDERPAARPCRCDGILTGNQAAECSESPVLTARSTELYVPQRLTGLARLQPPELPPH
jgi:hypothetical protein